MVPKEIDHDGCSRNQGQEEWRLGRANPVLNMAKMEYHF